MVGKARMCCTLKSRNIRANVTMLVLRVPSLMHVIMGWKSLYEWGIFSIQPQANTSQSSDLANQPVLSRKVESVKDTQHQYEGMREQEQGDNQSLNESNRGKNIQLAYNDVILYSDLPSIF